jgi:hypothetical protein
MDEPVPPTPAPVKPKKRCKKVNITQFLKSPAEFLYQDGFTEIKPDEIKIRLRVKDGKVEMVVMAYNQGRIDQFIMNFSQGEVFAELCG